jgi:gluconate 5-dehydrogenase
MTALDLFRLSGKSAIVTGGGRGLGQYIALALADAGANVLVCSRKIEALEETKRQIEEHGGRALALACDVTNPDDVQRVTQTAIDVFGGVDILVNNSGATWGQKAEEMPLDKFQTVVNINVTGTFSMSQAVGRAMIAHGSGGAIVNIASIAGLTGGHPDFVNVVGYSSSKGAIISMTRDLATSWAPYAIRVNAIAPGWFPTKMSTALLERFREPMLANIPLHRFGTMEDIQGVAIFLASPASAYITGQTVIVDGGTTAW